jgi:hypothetical protein
MSQFGRGYDINQTFVIEPQDNNLPVLSACTVVYTNFIESCSGDTQIFLGTGIVSINGSLETQVVSATTYYGDGSNLTGIPYVTGGTYNDGTATFTNNTGGTFSVSGFSTGGGGIFTGGTVTGPTEFTNGLSANTFSATTYLGLPLDIYLTGGTSVGSGTSIYDSIVDKNVNIRSITSDTTNKVSVLLDNQTINLGVNEQNLTLWNLVVSGNKLISGGVSYVSGLTFSVSPLEYLINGVIYNTDLETTVTLLSGDSTFDRIDVIYADISGNTGVITGTPSANPEKTFVNDETQIEITFVLVPANSTTPDVSTKLLYNENVGPTAEWSFNSRGVQPTRIIGNSTGNSYSGIYSIRVSGVTGINTTNFILSSSTSVDTSQYATLQFAVKNLISNSTTSRIRVRFLTNNIQNGIAVNLNGAGTSGFVQYNATNTSTYQLISIPIWSFGLTNTNVNTIEFAFYPLGTPLSSNYYFDKIEFVDGAVSPPPRNNWTTIKADAATTIVAPSPSATLTLSGGTNISASISGTTAVVFNLDDRIRLIGVTANTISATTYQNLPSSTFTGGTVNGPSIFTGGLSANTFSATTYLGLPKDVFVTGGTYNAGTATFTNNTGGTFNVVGFSSGGGEFSGGTVTGPTIFTNGLSANTFSASTYLGLPLDVFVTGGTYSNGVINFVNNTGGTFNISGLFTGNTDVFVTGGTYNAGTAVFTNNTGGTFNVVGFSTGGGTFTGGTVTGPTIFTGGLSANTFSASTYFGLPKDVFVTGGTYSNGTAVFRNNTGGTFNVVGLTTPFTGGTVSGNTIFTNGLTANTLSVSSFNGSTNRIVEVNSGGTLSATQEIISAYIVSGSTAANLLENTTNWDINGIYTGTTISNTFMGQKHYNFNYFFEAVDNNLWIRLIRG